MNLDGFRQWAIAQGSVANPTSNKDNQYLGECVSLVQQYISKVYGIPWAARGHAKSWVNNPVAGAFDKVSGAPQAGDIIIYDQRFGGGYGHIAIGLGNNQMLDQNGAGNGKIKVGNIWPNYSAILRPKNNTSSKGGDMPLTKDQIDFLYRRGVGRPAQQSDIDANLGKDPGNLINALKDSKEAADFDDELIYHAYLGYLRRPPEESAIKNARSQGRREYFNNVQKSQEKKDVDNKLSGTINTEDRDKLKRIKEILG